MRRNIAAAVVLLGLTVLLISSCAFFTPQEQELAARIGSRRLAYAGAKHYPELFKSLGTTAEEVCKTEDSPGIITETFRFIALQITNKTADPLLKADLQDLIECMALRVDATFKILEVTQEQLRVLKAALCSFAQGVDLALESKHLTLNMEVQTHGP